MYFESRKNFMKMNLLKLILIYCIISNKLLKESITICKHRYDLMRKNYQSKCYFWKKLKYNWR